MARNQDPLTRITFTLPLSMHHGLNARIEGSQEYRSASDYIQTLLKRDLESASGGTHRP